MRKRLVDAEQEPISPMVVHTKKSLGAGPLIVGACVGTALFAVIVAAATYVCYRKKAQAVLQSPGSYHLQHSLKKGPGYKDGKLTGPGGLMFSKTPAVRSPTGGGSGPILKTSPSPTGSKSPPSMNTSPTQGGRTVLSGQQPRPPVTKPVVQQHKPTPHHSHW
ncbi:synaptotagmin-4-like [Tropilaelaps mercedesae]|uniref:Synaptotagmin-4-like n=1 Tax=Tropilaelaps mercedesae TaxID=418985 RepID=A0A1V9Y3G1_9ACAR|nr:synaptotagmin-4-like [Tropilaelaps mercedesae]